MNPNKYEPMDWKLKENSRPGTKSSWQKSILGVKGAEVTNAKSIQ